MDTPPLVNENHGLAAALSALVTTMGAWWHQHGSAKALRSRVKKLESTQEGLPSKTDFQAAMAGLKDDIKGIHQRLDRHIDRGGNDG